MVCAFTGHRPEHLPWRTDETDARCAALKAVLQREVSALYQRGFSAFLCGMARGCDLYFAEAVLALRDAGELPDANLTAMLPCPSQGRALGRKNAGSLPANSRAVRRGSGAGGGIFARLHAAAQPGDGGCGGCAADGVRRQRGRHRGDHPLRQKARHRDRAGVALKFHFGGNGRTESSAPANATAAIRRAL